LLITALKDPTIDDTYVKLSFHIDSPIIRFDPIDDKKRGEKFVVTATTNLGIKDEIFIEIFSSITISNTQNKSFAVFKGVVVVIKGDAGLNKVTFNIDTAIFDLGEYIIKASAMNIDVHASTSFKIISN